MTKANSSLINSNLFTPITIGKNTLGHRVVHAPTSRSRSSTEHFVPTDLLVKYYDSRSKAPGTLIIFESTLISPKAGLVPFKPGLWSDKQASALKNVTDAIHANGSYVSCQIFGPGRVANLDLAQQYNLSLKGPSAGLYPSTTQEEKAKQLGNELQSYTIEEIHQLQDAFVEAAVNGITKAGFDYIELHNSSGFLLEQFFLPLSNQRTDEYGGSIENRSRFVLEIIDRLIAHPEVGAHRVGIRTSAWSTHNGMEFPEDLPVNENPSLLGAEYLLKQLEIRKNQGNELAYVSISEARVSGNTDVETDDELKNNDKLLAAWSGKLIRSGGYATNYKGDYRSLPSNIPQLVFEGNDIIHYTHLRNDVNQDDRTLIGFSRPFTSNPDFVDRLRKGLKLDVYQRKYFYTHTADGYLTFGPYHSEGSEDEPAPKLHFEDEELHRDGVPLI
ncbi:NAPDH dehydrogenase [Scheffersomyces amazonensis]|uniref:NAPDH dehydrogenase n=1 Tax=Scheffersomyces amazonensis TaxID=1078765 RepID=UPI00315D63C7